MTRLTTPAGENITPSSVVDGDEAQKVRVVGHYFSGGKLHACLWTESSFIELAPLRSQAAATVINQNGQIYGTDYADGGFDPQLVGWGPSGNPFVLSFPPYTFLGAMAVNNLNSVVSNGYKAEMDGSQTNYGGYVVPGATRLLPLSGDLSAEGYSINDAGWIVGTSGLGPAVLWIGGGTPASLGSFGGTDGAAFGINKHGQAVGYSTTTASSDRHAFIWQTSVMTRLPEGGNPASWANAINDVGEIVGRAGSRAAYWKDGQFKDLNVYAPAADSVTFHTAHAISEKGAIVVTGTINGSGGSPANYVLIPIETTTISVDLDHDGIIKFDDTTDKTSASNPFVFWTNDDVDVSVSRNEEDADPNASPRDFEDLMISNKRDLEDFARLSIRAPTSFDPANAQWSVNCTMEVSSGAPGINLWSAVADSTDYLSDTTIADQQIATSGSIVRATFLPANTVVIPNHLFTRQDRSAFYAPLLFEGRTSGTFAVVVHFLHKGTPVSEARCYFDLRPMSAFYDHFTVGDTATLDVSQIPATATQIQTATIQGSTADYILFVHGWRMRPWERRAFAETAYKRLWHLGYKGGFGLYSWPTEYLDGRLATLWKDNDPLQNYDRSEEKAWRSAQGLHGTLHDLAAQGIRVHLLAHSMGNVVASEALEMEGESAAPQRLVANYAATQAATVAHSYDPFTPQVLRRPKTPNVYATYPPTQTTYFANLNAAAGKVINLHNRKDYALGYWLTNQRWKPDVGWDYSSTQGFFRNQSPTILLNFPQDQAEIFSFIAPSWSNALGREPLTQVNISVSYDLNAAPVGLGNNSSEHSGQFNSTMLLRKTYWSKLGELMDVALNDNTN